MKLQDYSQEAKTAVNDIRSRAGEKGQFLNWIGVLPKTQLENLDNIYNMAFTVNASDKLIILLKFIAEPIIINKQ